MEIELNNYDVDKNIKLDKGKVITLDTSYKKTFVRDLETKYGFKVIDYSNRAFIGNDIKEEFDVYAGDYDKKSLNEILEIFDLKKDFLEKRINNLSNIEKVYVNIIRNLLLDVDKLLFLSFTKYLDYNDKKIMIKLFNYLKDKKYYIVVTSESVDSLYEFGDSSIVCYKGYFKYDDTDEVYTDVDGLLKHKIDPPTLCLLTYKAKKKKKVNLFYRKDVRDTIKDIYKHV